MEGPTLHCFEQSAPCPRRTKQPAAVPQKRFPNDWPPKFLHPRNFGLPFETHSHNFHAQEVSDEENRFEARDGQSPSEGAAIKSAITRRCVRPLAPHKTTRVCRSSYFRPQSPGPKVSLSVANCVFLWSHESPLISGAGPAHPWLRAVRPHAHSSVTSNAVRFFGPVRIARRSGRRDRRVGAGPLTHRTTERLG